MRAGRWAVVVATVLGMVASGCGDEEGTRSTVTDALEAIFASADVDGDQVYLDAYARGSARNVCADRPADDQWYARRTARLRGGLVNQDRMLEAALDHFAADGFHIERYRPTSGMNRPAIRAVSDEVVVTMYVQADGTTFAAAFAGPCAERIGRFSSRLYQRAG